MGCLCTGRFRRRPRPTIPEPTNTYQWSRAVLRLRAPTALAEVLRLEADSKFFRSLFVVFLFLAVCSFVHLSGSVALVAAAIIVYSVASFSLLGPDQTSQNFEIQSNQHANLDEGSVVVTTESRLPETQVKESAGSSGSGARALGPHHCSMPHHVVAARSKPIEIKLLIN
jgi:hypothetical protein